MTRRTQFLKNLTAFLEYKKEAGFKTLEISPETRAKLKRAVANKSPEASLPPSSPPASRPSPAPAPTREPEPTPLDDGIRITGKTPDQITEQIKTCTGCGLHASRHLAVPGEGKTDRPDILFVGEAPNPDEDAQGRPFSGEHGQLLTKMIGAMGYRREEVFITNIVKCRTPGCRIPHADEVSTCMTYLRAQIKLINPKCIVAMGKPAVEGMLNKPIAITRFRGTWSTFEGIDLMPTFHPGYLQKVPSKKREAWSDLQAVMVKVGKTK